MLIPTKHENLSRNTLVLGADVITALKKDDLNVESVFSILKARKNVSLDEVYNVILFLWLADIVDVEGHSLRLRGTRTNKI